MKCRFSFFIFEKIVRRQKCRNFMQIVSEESFSKLIQNVKISSVDEWKKIMWFDLWIRLSLVKKKFFYTIFLNLQLFHSWDGTFWHRLKGKKYSSRFREEWILEMEKKPFIGIHYFVRSRSNEFKCICWRILLLHQAQVAPVECVFSTIANSPNSSWANSDEILFSLFSSFEWYNNGYITHSHH